MKDGKYQVIAELSDNKHNVMAVLSNYLTVKEAEEVLRQLVDNKDLFGNFYIGPMEDMNAEIIDLRNTKKDLRKVYQVCSKSIKEDGSHIVHTVKENLTFLESKLILESFKKSDDPYRVSHFCEKMNPSISKKAA